MLPIFTWKISIAEDYLPQVRNVPSCRLRYSAGCGRQRNRRHQYKGDSLPGWSDDFILLGGIALSRPDSLRDGCNALIVNVKNCSPGLLSR